MNIPLWVRTRYHYGTIIACSIALFIPLRDDHSIVGASAVPRTCPRAVSRGRVEGAVDYGPVGEVAVHHVANLDRFWV